MKLGHLGYTEEGSDGTIYVTADAFLPDVTYVDVPAPGTDAGVPAAQSTDWLKMISEAAPKVLQLWNAQQVADINIARAQRGLPPLNPAAYGPQVGVTLPAGTSNMLLYGALAVGAFMILGQRRR